MILRLLVKLFQENKCEKWIIAMEDELISMQQNEVWELLDVLEGFKLTSCKRYLRLKKIIKGRLLESKTCCYRMHVVRRY